MKKILFAILVGCSMFSNAQDVQKDEITKSVIRIVDSINKAKEQEDKNKPKKEHWYDNIGIRGYAQIRYNGLLSSNDKVSCDQCDKSWGNEGGFFMRRIRVIFYGQIYKNERSAGFSRSRC